MASLLAAYDEAYEFLEVSPLLPAIIGSYRVLRELGRGGMGSVYLARRDDEEYRKLVAVKVLRAGFPRSFQERFRRERQILASLDHPNISTLFDAGSLPDGRPYCVMEYVEGLPIHEYCRLHGISSREILALFLPICSAVQYAHQHLVIHRDLKPANILIRPDGVPKLLDFGIAHLAEEGEAEALTRTGQALFTPEYASPEQLKGVRVTTASDVYSLGVLLHRLLTGNLPYPAQGVNAIEAARLVLDSDPARAGIDADLDSILLKALRKEPQLRYATVAAMAADIENYLAGRTVGARRSTFGYVAGKFIRR
ncbi:MAG: serine/threonine protein kinase, partial [Bryobacterales bacterium]|nr:serine/threonine protein kinase [Bryobacterales bacterium]